MSERKLEPVFVFREHPIDNIIAKAQLVKNKGSARYILLQGKAGTGKSTIMNHLPLILKNSGISSTHISLNCEPSLNLLDSLSNYVMKVGIPENENGFNGQPASLYSCLLRLKDPKNDILLLTLDNFQNISPYWEKEFHLLIEDELAFPVFILMNSRKSHKGYDCIAIENFNDFEYKELISQSLSKGWYDEFADTVHWLEEVTSRNPLLLSVALRRLKEKDLITSTFCANLDELKSKKLNLVRSDLIDDHYDVRSLAPSLVEILSYIALAVEGISLKAIQNLIPTAEKEIIQSLIDNGWIVHRNKVLEIFHPLIKEKINTLLSPGEKNSLYRKLYEQNSIHNNYYLSRITHLKKGEKKKLLEYADTLEKNNQFHSALTIYSRYKDQQPAQARCCYRLGKSRKAEKLCREILAINQQPPVDVFYSMAGVLFYKGAYKECLRFLHNGMKREDITTDQMWMFRMLKTLCHHVLRESKDTNLQLEWMKNNYGSKKKYRLYYDKIRSEINMRTPLGFDTEKHAVSALRTAKKLHDHQLIIYFTGSLMVHFIHLNCPAPQKLYQVLS